MAEEQIPDLHELADSAQGAARPLPAAQVRSLGDRRRGRRTLATAAIALVALAAIGGAVFAGLAIFRGPGQPSTVAGSPGAPAASTDPRANPTTGADPTTSPGTPAPPVRTLSTRNLLAATDLPLEDYDNQSAVTIKQGVGRLVSESSVCLPPSGLNELGASQVLSRNFAYETIDGSEPERGYPFRDRPVIYTQALQFADAAAAKAARDRYQGWLKACPAQLQPKGYQLLPQLGFDPIKIDVTNGSAVVTEIAYRRPGGADGENGIWESVGLTVVGDRMMITVFLHWGMDWEVTIDAAEGDLLHPQLGLCDTASERLAVR